MLPWLQLFWKITKISEVENKILNTGSLVTRTTLNTKISEAENKALDNSKYLTIQEFKKLRAESFAARLKRANLINKTEFHSQRTRLNKRVASNKTKNVEVQKKKKKYLNNLITKDYIFFFGRVYYTSNDQSQNTFVYQPKFDTLEFK